MVFSVRDNGAGFDENYKHRFFGAFQRLHSSSEFEGAGIGLASAQRAVNRQGGRIRAEAAVNQEAKFFLHVGVGREVVSGYLTVTVVLFSPA